MLTLIIVLYVIGILVAGYGRLMVTVNGLEDKESNEKNMLLIFIGILFILIATLILFAQYT